MYPYDQQPHPDELAQQHAVKQITRGGRQAADDKVMDAYWLALEAGCDNEQAAEVFSKTYKQLLHGKETVLPIK